MSACICMSVSDLTAEPYLKFGTRLDNINICCVFFSGGDALDSVLLISALLICVYIHEAIHFGNYTASSRFKIHLKIWILNSGKSLSLEYVEIQLRIYSPTCIVRMRQIELP